MKILITGANGRIGQHLAHSLEGKYKLILVSREAISRSQVSNSVYLQADLTNFSKIRSIISSQKPKIIIHLAGITGQVCEDDPKLANKVNVDVTSELATVAAQQGVKKFVFASSAAVYPKHLDKPLKEEDTDPQNYYGITKLRAEEELKKIAINSEMCVIVLRIFNVYGPGFEDSLINKLMLSSAKGKIVALIDPKNYVRDYIYIDDVVESFRLSIEQPFIDNFIILNIATGKPTSTDRVINILKANGIEARAEVINVNSPTYVYADITKAKQILGFNPDLRLRGLE